MKTQQLPQEILDQIKSIQEKNQAIQIELGQIELAKLDIKKRRLNAEQYVIELREEQKTLGEFLEKQYGSGTINLDEGIFTAIQQPQEE